MGQSLLIMVSSWSHSATHQTRQDSTERWSARHRDHFPTTHTTPKDKNIHVAGTIRTHISSRRAAADPRLRPRGHWDRHRGLQAVQKKYLYLIGFHSSSRQHVLQLHFNFQVFWSCLSVCLTVCGWNINVPTIWWRHKNYVKRATGLCTLVLKRSLFSDWWNDPPSLPLQPIHLGNSTGKLCEFSYFVTMPTHDRLRPFCGQSNIRLRWYWDQ